MKFRNILLLLTVLIPVVQGRAGTDEKSDKTTKAQKTAQASPDRPDSSHKGSVTGTVTDEKGNAVDKAKVELTDPVTKEPSLSVMTDKKGRYTFSGLLPGAYRIQAKKEQMESDLRDIKVSNGPSVGPTLMLNPRRT